jgi:hypothetical protein
MAVHALFAKESPRFGIAVNQEGNVGAVVGIVAYLEVVFGVFHGKMVFVFTQRSQRIDLEDVLASACCAAPIVFENTEHR